MLKETRYCDYCGKTDMVDGKDMIQTYDIIIDNMTKKYYSSGTTVDLCDSCYERFVAPLSDALWECTLKQIEREEC